MKNYIKVVLATKNIAIYVFEDADEVATRDAITRALSMVEMRGGRMVAWSLTGHVARQNSGIGQVYNFGGM